MPKFLSSYPLYFLKYPYLYSINESCRKMETMKKMRCYIFREGRLLLRHDDGRYAVWVGDEGDIPVKVERLHLFEPNGGELCYVGQGGEEGVPDGYEWVDLRASYHLLAAEDYKQAGKAAELLYFDLHHQYCGLCGAPMRWNTAISKCCTACGEEIWPQLSTAIIVLVHRGDEALLVKAKSFRRDFYGLVAGFVETGESLEECVAREVREETGLEIGNIRYFGSQPWPYPMGLMVGFHADYRGGDIQLVDGELRDAAFFSRDHLPTIPEKLSMARMLIDDWVEGGANEHENLHM